jgi:hypothetical protein
VTADGERRRRAGKRSGPATITAIAESGWMGDAGERQGKSMTISVLARVGAQAAAFGLLAIGASNAASQVSLNQIRVDQSPAATAAQASPARLAAVAPALRASERLPEGTEVRVRLDESLSSATSTVGDEFAISTEDDIHLADGTIVPGGFRGRGEVVAAHKKGMLGKAGELSVRLDYIRIGNVRVNLRASASAEGHSGQTTAVVLSLLVTPLFLMHHGADVVFPKGHTITAYVDQDADLPTPLPAPPQGA